MGGIPAHKWKRTFYERLDFEQRHRMYCHYDQILNAVLIGFPDKATTDIEEVWYYFLDTDRVFRIPYGATCFGNLERQIADATTWQDWLDSGILWSAIVGSWGSLQARFGFKATAHGTLGGDVHQHDRDLITQAGAQPQWSYESPISALEWPRYLKTADRLTVEHINANNDTATFTAVTGDGRTETGNVIMDLGDAGDLNTATRHFRLTGQHLGYQVNGGGPVLIKGMKFDYFLDGAEVIRAAS
jgi:hypothetical protein